MSKPILCLDFDGVLHSYTSGWQGADVVSDPPVEGALDFLLSAARHFQVHIFSSRSNQPGGIAAMRKWLEAAFMDYYAEPDGGLAAMSPVYHAMDKICWPTEKPPAFLTIDDRAILFTGLFPDPKVLLKFRPWNKS